MRLGRPRRRGTESGSEGEFLAAARGYIDAPAAGSEAARGIVQILGWCLFPGSSVARVEVSVDSAPPTRARLGMPRGDLPELTDHPSAPIAAFEYMADLTAAGDGEGRVTVSAVAHALDGRRLEIAPVTFELTEGDRAAEYEGRAAELRARATMNVRARLAASDEGVRLLVFSHQLPYGGASLYLAEVLRRFARKPGFECTVVTLEDGPLRDELEGLGIPVHVTNGYPVARVEQYEGNQAELIAWAAAQRFNVALVNTLGSFSGADVAARLGIPAVWAVHESFDLPLFWSTAFMPGTLHPYVAARAERSLRSAAAVIFEAEATRRLFLPYAEPERLITVPYGIELDAIRAARASYRRSDLRRGLGVPEHARVLLCLGTIEPRKSQAMLAEAFATIADDHPDAVLVLVGAVDSPWCAPYLKGVRDFVERRGLASRVRIEPVVPHPLPWHAASDFHVCASDLESLPRSVLEAMAFGKPVVSTRVFGVPEVIDDGATGYLCDTRDAGDLARALDRALSADEEELGRIGGAAAELVSERHEPAGYAERLWGLLATLASDADADPAAVLGAGANAPAERAL